MNAVKEIGFSNLALIIMNPNKFSKAVFFGNNSEFQVSTQEEQNIANNCKRLIQNSIICWNYLYMTKKLKEAKDELYASYILKPFKTALLLIGVISIFTESDNSEFSGLKDFRLSFN